MTVHHTGSMWVEYYPEAYFGAGGAAGAIYGKHAPDASELLACNYVYNERQTFPMVEYDQTANKGPAREVTSRYSITEGKIILPGNRIQFLQNSTWMTFAVGNLVTCAYQEGGLTGKTGATATGLANTTTYYFKLTVNGGSITEYSFTTATDTTWYAVIKLMNTACAASGAYFTLFNGDVRCCSKLFGASSAIEMGAGTTGNNVFASLTGWSEEVTVAGSATSKEYGGQLPKTWCEHYDLSAIEYTAYGCYMTTYTVEIPVGKALREIYDYPAYDVVTEDIVGDTGVWFLDPATYPPYTHKDTSLKIWGNAVSNMGTCKVSVTKTFHKETQGGEYTLKFPYLEEVGLEIEMEFFDYDSNVLLDLQSATISLFPIEIDLGPKTLIATQMKVKPGTLNIQELPEMGVKRYRFTAEIGGDASIILV